MEREDFNRMVRLFRHKLLMKYEPGYLKQSDRKTYLNHFKQQILTFLAVVSDDEYQKQIITLNNEGYYTDEPLPKTLQKIEKRRQHWRNQQWGGIEYSQPYIPVDDLVEEEGERAVIRFLAQCYAAESFLKLIVELQKAIERNGLGQQEELALIRRAKEGKALRETAKPMKESFRWIGKGSNQKAGALFHRLHKRGFIDKETTSEQFIAIFSGKPVEKPVRWTGSASQLFFLIEHLALSAQLEMPPASYKTTAEGRNEITDEQAYASWLYLHIENCFLDEDHNPYNGKRMKHVKSALRNKSKSKKPERGQELEKIITDAIAVLT